jgi:hypothetical protein
MGMLMDAVWQLVETIIVIVQLTIFGILSPLYGAALLIVGALNLLWVLLGMGSFDNIDLLFEPLEWAKHQLMVGVGASDDFRAAPYL